MGSLQGGEKTASDRPVNAENQRPGGGSVKVDESSAEKVTVGLTGGRRKRKKGEGTSTAKKVEMGGEYD